MQEELNPMNPGGWNDVERALLAARPARTGIDRDQLMFEAGRAAERGHRGWMGHGKIRLWQGLCGVLMAVVAGMMALPRGGRGGQPLASHRATPVRLSPGTGDVSYASWSRERGVVKGELGDYLTLRDNAMTGTPPPPPANTAATDANAASSLRIARPALRLGEGLEALPAWQQQEALTQTGGNRS